MKKINKISIIFLVLFLIMVCENSIKAQSPGKISPRCPKITDVQTKLSQTFKRPLEVKNITPIHVLGLCEVQVVFGGRNQILYVDPENRYYFLGQLVDTVERKNLTRETLNKLNRFSPEDLKKLHELVAFSIGPEDAPKSVYVVTDPKCPFCKKAEAILEKLANDGLLRIHFVLFPLPSHKDAKEICISIICDKKGLEEFKSGYRSENQCEEGTKQVVETMRFLSKHGISGTPSYIFPDGSFHSGVLQREALMKRLKLEEGKKP